ncbi:MAG: Regulatory protein RecX [Candidatus Woesebacteria bacterium GW2011_GWA1_33_30]|uniref:Regulatory protein RecX n=1 Tax=Candidatus Woesebacteria bacterium GW2011_GWA2_33_28 TaxID=1618561 RepID=A0A0F9ZU09_9BACT|nr:MAG: Regulatory protein RecX [Candidatus Woesebacteria bacterium GW2011_GWA2_33_28]KKP48601.1 MAG: Regulatory protein RecX [Candidatus Woesebacteria bacterium GW2011_GWA1_33_30]KKP49740.1 MAG: Regulatory protein RecX [Microgenomates group bacterium GW2011_GWC1_33_32]KKP52357.1 MAG: Regulatory protein RecX [Candidatus Woesebacteria bacterium GW2011_GWB1_33_38]KKP57042.1 MAG: Regulatory protein RecX [Microgenomates group bacterium GW2011_GWD1_33_9]
MPIITSIKPQKNNKRVNIYLDNEFGFGLDLENFVKFHLKVDQELTDEQITKIVKDAEFQKILDKLLRFAMLRPRSKKEINDYLKRKKVHENIKEELFSRLESFELINDEQFAKWWVEQRQSFSPKSKRVLSSELLIKGIDREIIKNILEETKIDEVKLAKDLIEQKSYKWEKLDDKIKRQKINQYLAGKGFSWEITSNVLELNDYGRK